MRCSSMRDTVRVRVDYTRRSRGLWFPTRDAELQESKRRGSAVQRLKRSCEAEIT